MKILILMCLIIVFISIIFILFIFSDISDKYMECYRTGENKMFCDLEDFGIPLVFGLIMAGVFVLVDLLVVYFLFNTILSKDSLAYISRR